MNAWRMMSLDCNRPPSSSRQRRDPDQAAGANPKSGLLRSARNDDGDVRPKDVGSDEPSNDSGANGTADPRRSPRSFRRIRPAPIRGARRATGFPADIGTLAAHAPRAP